MKAIHYQLAKLGTASKTTRDRGIDALTDPGFPNISADTQICNGPYYCKHLSAD